jgi:ribosomal-protein-alanine N-acetyltransferase
MTKCEDNTIQRLALRRRKADRSVGQTLRVVPQRRIKTRRLILDALRLHDAIAIFQQCASDPVMTRFLPELRLTCRRDAESFAKSVSGMWVGDGMWVWGIYTRDTRMFVGIFQVTLYEHDAEIGYLIRRPVWGRGYAGEAVAAALESLREPLGERRVWARAKPANRGSVKILESTGFRLVRMCRAVNFLPVEERWRGRLALYRLDAWRGACMPQSADHGGHRATRMRCKLRQKSCNS